MTNPLQRYGELCAYAHYEGLDEDEKLEFNKIESQLESQLEIVGRLKNKLDTMNLQGECSLVWVHDVFQSILGGEKI